MYVDLINSRASGRIAEQPQLLSLAKSLLAGQTLTQDSLTLEYNFGEPVGNSDIVATGPADVIIYAKLLQQKNYTRFVKKREMVQSTFVSARLHRDEQGNYELDDLWFGELAPPLPDEPHAAQDSSSYWQSHAVVLNGQPLQRNTTTRDWPFERAVEHAAQLR